MKKLYITLILCVLVLVMTFYFVGSKKYDAMNAKRSHTQISYAQRQIKIGTSLYTFDISDTDALRERGLSYRTGLSDHTGMLFVFETPGIYKFWMKDMNFPLDIIWLDQYKKVVYIEPSLSPETYPKAFGPGVNTQYVLELNAGDAQRIGLTVGDTLNF